MFSVKIKNSLIYRCFMAQISHPSKGDWVSDILMNMEDLGIEISLSYIRSMTKNKFYSIVKEKVNFHALRYLLKLDRVAPLMTDPPLISSTTLSGGKKKRKKEKNATRDI